MTEKQRFKVIETITNNDRRIYELTKNDIGYYNFKGEKLLAHMICNELNKLLEEKEQLKHDATVLICSNQEYRKKNEQLKQQNKRLEEKIQRERTSFTKTHERWSKEAENKIKELSEENEQLKGKASSWKITASEEISEKQELMKQIVELRIIDKEKDIEVEHINNIYKEFGFKGLIDYAKDKLYNYGAVREVDEGLWLLATGGWSDNEFWLDCLLHWDFMYGKGHYRATTSGGGYYYSEKPYAYIKVILEDLE